MRSVAWAFLLIAAAAHAQPAASPEDIYQLARRRVLDEVNRLPNFTCVQTITRRVYANAPHRRPPSCADVLRDRETGNHHLPLVMWDRLRVDVAIADKHEVYSWVSAAKFDESDLRQLVRGGQTVMGDFGPLLLSIFEDHPAMRFQGERKVGGRRRFEYSYETSAESSQYQVKVGPEQFNTPYEGSVYLDPNTADAVRVIARSAELPELTGYCQVTRELEYSRLRIGAGDAMIPREASSWAIGRDGVAMVSTSDYSGCREYVGESSLRFDEPGSSLPSATSGTANPDATAAIPPGLPFACTIVTPIDSDTAATGDPFEAILRSPLTDASGKLLAPAGARLYGRLTAFTGHPANGGRPQSYQIGLQFRSIAIDGKRLPLAATPVGETLGKKISILLNVHPNVGTFVIHEKQVHLTSLESKWVTAIPSAEPQPR